MKTEYLLSASRRGTRPRKPIELMMTPMIDVIFLLLVFFLATTSFQVLEKLLPGAVAEVAPAQGSAPAPPDLTVEPEEQIILKAQRDADVIAWTLGGVRLPDMLELRQRLTTLARVNNDVPLIIDPAADTPVGEVIQVYDYARSVGLTRIFMATRPPAR
jgi:biopolymer transport protein ExbD